MNHTERIAETARRHRHLTRRMVKEAIETYLDLLAEEMAMGNRVDIYGICTIQVSLEKATGNLYRKTLRGDKIRVDVRYRLRSSIRLLGIFKKRCYQNMNPPE